MAAAIMRDVAMDDPISNHFSGTWFLNSQPEEPGVPKNTPCALRMLVVTAISDHRIVSSSGYGDQEHNRIRYQILSEMSES